MNVVNDVSTVRANVWFRLVLTISLVILRGKTVRGAMVPSGATAVKRSSALHRRQTFGDRRADGGRFYVVRSTSCSLLVSAERLTVSASLRGGPPERNRSNQQAEQRSTRILTPFLHVLSETRMGRFSQSGQIFERSMTTFSVKTGGGC